MFTHLAVMVVYNLRSTQLLSPKVTERLKFAEDYATPIFEQNWSMFAPNPPSSTFSCLIMYKVVSSNGSTKESEYYDIHDPVVNASKRSLFSLDLRLLKYMHGCIMNTISRNNDYLVATKMDKSSRDHLPDYLAVNSSGYQCLNEYAKIVFERSALKALNGQKVYFKLRFVNDAFPKFAQRDLSFYEEKNHKYYFMEIGYHKL